MGVESDAKTPRAPVDEGARPDAREDSRRVVRPPPPTPARALGEPRESASGRSEPRLTPARSVRPRSPDSPAPGSGKRGAVPRSAPRLIAQKRSNTEEAKTPDPAIDNSREAAAEGADSSEEVPEANEVRSDASDDISNPSATGSEQDERERRITSPAPGPDEGALVSIANEPVRPRAPNARLEPIVQFGRFGILGRLATGGMADIFLAEDAPEGASRNVAIKVIRGEFSEDSDFARMFLNEGRLAMRLSHPNLCPVFECGRSRGRFFMAMEFVEGQTLRDVLVRSAERKTKLPIPVLLKVFSFVAEALEFAHRAKDAEGRPLKIVHRDVSPHNIMIRYDGVVKLLDFGVAKAERSSHSTESGALKGKFSYMSPEQALGDPIDHRADIFSLGVCLFESLTGRRLFHRKAQYDTLKAILELDPPLVSSFRDDVPEDLEAVLAKALAKAPEDRYRRAVDLQHAIERVLADSREVVGSDRIGQQMGALFEEEIAAGPTLDTGEEVRGRFAELTTTEEGDALPAELGPSALGASPSRMGWYVAAALALVVVVGAGLLLLGPGNEPAMPPAASTPSVSETPATPAASAAVTPETPPPPGMPEEVSRANEPAAVGESPTGTEDDTVPSEAEQPSAEAQAQPQAEPEAEQNQSQTRRRRSRNRGARRGGSRIVRTPGF